MSAQQFMVATIKNNDSITWDEIVQNLIEKSDDSSVFNIYEQSQNYISGSYVFQTTGKQTQYNFSNNTFEMVPIVKTNIVKFDINKEKNKLLLWGGKKNIPFLITQIEMASKYSIVIEYNKLNFVTTVNQLLNNKNVKIKKINVENVVIDNGIVANCNITFTNDENLQKTTIKYIDQIKQVTISLIDGEESITIRLYASGTIIICKDKDEISDSIYGIILSIFGGK